MIELIITIGLYLAMALLIGVSIGWFFSKILGHKKNQLEIKVLDSTINEQDRMIERLSSHQQNQQQEIERLINEGLVCRHESLKKSNTLRKKSDELYKAKDKLAQVNKIEKERLKLAKELALLHVTINEKDIELRELESVFLKDEIPVKKHEVEERDLKVEHLEVEVKRLEKVLNKKESETRHFNENELTKTPIDEDCLMVSKDQFKEIEKRLIEYKSRADKLESRNSELSQVIKRTSDSRASKILDKVNASMLGLKEVAIPKFFKSRDGQMAQT